MTRFINACDKHELINLYHLARTALSGEDDSRWARMCWAARRFSEAHPQVSSTGAYKDLCALLAW